MKLGRKAKIKLHNQMKSNHRGDTWVGIRPVVFADKRNAKSIRRQNKILCRT